MKTYFYKPTDLTDTALQILEFENLTRRRFIIGAGALALGACGAPGTSAPTATVATTRTVVDLAGRSVDVPMNPQRIVVLDYGEINFHLVDLGIVPVGSTTDATTIGGNFPAQLGDARQTIQPVGDSSAPNLELVTKLQPDLIIHNKDFSDPGIDILSAIAPTVQFTAGALGKDPTSRTRFVADVVNRSAQGDEVITRWEAKLTKTTASINAKGKTCVIALLYGFEPTFELLGSEYPTGYVAERLGFTIVPTEVDGKPLKAYSPPFSLEQLPTVMDADVVFFLRFPDEMAIGEKTSGPIVRTVTSSPVWQAIPAVKEGRVIELDARFSRGDYGYVGLNATLDTIAQALARPR
jgi:iron complex transport system substrate-binding protein